MIVPVPAPREFVVAPSSPLASDVCQPGWGARTAEDHRPAGGHVRVRPLALAVHGALLAGLIAGPAVYVMAEKTVTLEVNGVAQTVDTHAATVADVLAENDVRVTGRDEVSPPRASQLIDGLRVAVISARPVLLVVDGTQRELWTTATTVAELSSQLGERYDSAYLSASRSERIPLTGLTMAVRLPKAVRLSVAGAVTSIVTTAPTWAATLVDLHVTLRPADVLSVPTVSAPTDGQLVTLTRVDLRSTEASQTIAFTSIRRSDPTRYVGTTTVVQAGITGRLVIAYKLTLRNGALVQRTELSRRVAVKPVPQIVAVGTKPKPKPVVHHTSVSGLNWAALANCESGGNPRSVGGGGAYFGLYQFSVGTWQGVGGSGNPIDASASEQTYRAQLLYLRQGRSPWPYCGRFL